MKKLIGFIALALALPAVASAQGNFQNIFVSIDTIGGLIVKLIPIVIGAAVLLFLYGLLQFFLSTESGKLAEARSFMVFGVVALFIMVSVWGLVNFLRNTLGVTGGANQPPPAPGLPSYYR